jgi:uncharacterized phage-associated protein
LEHAQTVARKLIEDKYILWREDPKKHSVYSAFNSAMKLSLDIPDDISKFVKESQITGAQNWRDTKKKEYLEAEDKLHNAINQTVEEFAKGSK